MPCFSSPGFSAGELVATISHPPRFQNCDCLAKLGWITWVESHIFLMAAGSLKTPALCAGALSGGRLTLLHWPLIWNILLLFASWGRYGTIFMRDSTSLFSWRHLLSVGTCLPFTPFRQQPGYSSVPLSSRPSFAVTQTLSRLREERSSPVSRPSHLPANRALPGSRAV